MNNTDWLNYKFHCSSLANLIVSSRSGIGLGETAKSYLREVWIKEVYGREKHISSPMMEKGTIVESDSLALVEQVTGRKYFKNQKQFENEYIIGTPDVTEELLDIKSSWDLWTFSAVDETKAYHDYYWQVLGYAWMLERESATVCYCLVNTPEHIIQHELLKISYHMSESEAEKYRINYEFDDIPPAQRIKRFTFPILEDDVEKLKGSIDDAREYLAELTL